MSSPEIRDKPVNIKICSLNSFRLICLYSHPYIVLKTAPIQVTRDQQSLDLIHIYTTSSSTREFPNSVLSGDAKEKNPTPSILFGFEACPRWIKSKVNMKVNLNCKIDCQGLTLTLLCFWVGKGAFTWPRDNKICSFIQPQLTWKRSSMCYSSHRAQGTNSTKTFSVFSFSVNFPPYISWVVLVILYLT